MTNLEYFKFIIQDLDTLDTLFQDTELNEIIANNVKKVSEVVSPDEFDKTKFRLANRNIYEGETVYVIDSNGIDVTSNFTVDTANGILTANQEYDEAVTVYYYKIDWKRAKADAIENILTNFRKLSNIVAGNTNLNYDDTKKILLDIYRQLKGARGSDLE